MVICHFGLGSQRESEMTNNHWTLAGLNTPADNDDKAMKVRYWVLWASTAMVACVDPIMLRADAGDLRIGTPPVLRLYAYKPAAYDGPIGQPMRIAAARREIEPFLILIIAGEKPAAEVQVVLPELVHIAGSTKIGPEHIEVAPLAYVKRETRGSTDLSMAGGTAMLGGDTSAYEARILRRDVRTFDVPAGCQQSVWVNVEVPADAEAGLYRGELVVRSGETTKRIPVELKVYRFALPEIPSMPGYTKWSPYSYDPQRSTPPYNYTQEDIDRVARFMIRYRWRVGRIYQKLNDSVPLPDVETVRRWKQWGGRDINLLRVDVSNQGKGQLTTDPKTGKLVFNESHLTHLWELLDGRVRRIKQAGLMDVCYLYGFDELPRQQVSVISDTFGRIKQRYGDVKTMAVGAHPWTALDEPELRNVDVMGYTTRLLRPELRDLHHSRGEQIIWYNISRVALVPARVQFWATYKDKLDGVLFHNMGWGGTVKRVAHEKFPVIDKADRAPMHYLPDGPASTTILEMWREGLEDVDYLDLLGQERARVRVLVEGKEIPKQVKKLLNQAEYYGTVPDSITQGKMAEARIYQTYYPMRSTLGRTECDSIEAVLIAKQQTDSMAHVMYVRNRIAELIEKLSAIEAPRDLN